MKKYFLRLLSSVLNAKQLRQQNKLIKSAQMVSSPWKESPYYDMAENTVADFWGEQTVFLKLFKKLDLTSTIELSCGHGRHAEKTALICGKITLVDIFDENLDFCRNRLKNKSNVSFLKGNGYDLSGIASDSSTSIYCYDSMVHFSSDIVESYIRDMKRVLKNGGLALLHHSNYSLQPDIKHYGMNPHARNHMSQLMFTEIAARAGLAVVESMIIPWGDVKELDCISLLRKEQVFAQDKTT